MIAASESLGYWSIHIHKRWTQQNSNFHVTYTPTKVTTPFCPCRLLKCEKICMRHSTEWQVWRQYIPHRFYSHSATLAWIHKFAWMTNSWALSLLPLKLSSMLIKETNQMCHHLKGWLDATSPSTFSPPQKWIGGSPHHLISTQILFFDRTTHAMIYCNKTFFHGITFIPIL